ncbi:MAG: tetratricopeptide repeat protein [Candidatus Omnitrophota bacterium]
MKNYEKAMDDFKTVLSLDPNHEGAYYMIGKIYYLQGKFPEAKAYFEKSLGINPFTHFAVLSYRRLGSIYSKLGNKNLSQEYCKKSQDLLEQIKNSEK